MRPCYGAQVVELHFFNKGIRPGSADKAEPVAVKEALVAQL